VKWVREGAWWPGLLYCCMYNKTPRPKWRCTEGGLYLRSNYIPSYEALIYEGGYDDDSTKDTTRGKEVDVTMYSSQYGGHLVIL